MDTPKCTGVTLGVVCTTKEVVPTRYPKEHQKQIKVLMTLNMQNSNSFGELLGLDVLFQASKTLPPNIRYFVRQHV